MRRKIKRTERLVLRPLVASDHAAWFEAHVHGGSKRSKHDRDSYLPRQCTRAIFERILARHAYLAREDQLYVFGVFLRRSRALVGMVDIAILHRRQLELGNLGYRIFHDHWRKGYGREAVLAAVHTAFEDLQLNRLEAVIDLDNRPSQRLARALGMRRECIRRKYYYQNGRFEDQVVWSAQRERYGHAPLVPRMARGRPSPPSPR